MKSNNIYNELKSNQIHRNRNLFLFTNIIGSFQNGFLIKT